MANDTAKPLPKALEDIFRELPARLEARLGFLPRLILFGSWARGTATEESDVDIAMILPSWDWELISQAWDVAWEVGFQYDRVISLIPVTEWEWRHAVSLLPLVGVLWREGIPICPSKSPSTEKRSSVTV